MGYFADELFIIYCRQDWPGDWWVLPQPPSGELRERKRKRPSPRTVCAAAGAPQRGWTLAAAAGDGGGVVLGAVAVVVGAAGRVAREGVGGERGGEGGGAAGLHVQHGALGCAIERVRLVRGWGGIPYGCMSTLDTGYWTCSYRELRKINRCTSSQGSPTIIESIIWFWASTLF